MEADQYQLEHIWKAIYKETIGELSGIREELEKKMKSTRKVRQAGLFATAGGLLLGVPGSISIPFTPGVSNFVAGAGAATTTAGMLTLGSSIVATYLNNSKQEKHVLTLLEVDRQLTAQPSTSNDEACSDKTTPIEITITGQGLRKLKPTGTISMLDQYIVQVQDEMEHRFEDLTVHVDDEEDCPLIN